MPSRSPAGLPGHRPAGAGVAGPAAAGGGGAPPEDLEGEQALRARRVDRVAERAEVDAAGLQALDHPEQVRQRAGQPVERDHHEGIAGLEAGEGAGQIRRQLRDPQLIRTAGWTLHRYRAQA